MRNFVPNFEIYLVFMGNIKIINRAYSIKGVAIVANQRYKHNRRWKKKN